MDSSLTRFLEQSDKQLPFHTQVDISYCIALALAYLHSNGIVHRDLSSNNVLLIGLGNRAKVTDFGMSKLADANPHITPMTMCPGTLAYMPPEALNDPPVYTNKLDCFSFSVLDIQILTRQFPNPSPHCKIMEIDDPRFPTGQVKVPVPEVERRRSHIDLVDPAHPLLPVALDCLKDRDRERPSAQELGNRLAALKDTPQYGESVQQGQRATTDGEHLRIRELQAESQERQSQLQEKDRTIATNERQLREKDCTIATKERQLRQLNQQLEANEQVTADFQYKHLDSDKQIHDLEQRLTAKDQQIRELQAEAQERQRQLQEKDRTIATKERQLRQLKVNEQDFQQKHLKTIQDLEQRLVAKDQQIREVQQQTYDQPTAKGQSASKAPLHLHWRKCGSSPCRMRRSSSVVDGNMAYIHTYDSNDVLSYDSEKQNWSLLDMSNKPRSVLACSMADLQQSCQPQSLGARLETLTLQEVWHQVADLPVRSSRCATLCGQLLAVGRHDDSCKNYTTAIHQYNPATNSWEVISHMPTARTGTLVAVLPGNKLMVVGGYALTSGARLGTMIDAVEIATLLE